MPHIHIFLQELDTLYHAGDLDLYEQYWQKACQHAERYFPGFTIAHANSLTQLLTEYLTAQ